MSILETIDQKLAAQSPAGLAIVCALLICIVSYLDYLTGYEVSFFIFYALPIWFSAWYLGKKPGLLCALACIIAWSVADKLTDHQYSHSLIPFWNGTIRFAFFVFTAFALDTMKDKIDLEKRNATFDNLTGILNGRGFRDRAEILFPLIRREKQSYAVCFIDVDNFKTVNDTMGHAEGDKILRKVGSVMTSSLRASDLVARLGGDEFVILLPRTDNAQAEKVLSSLKSALDDIAVTEKWPIGFSMGAGAFDSTKTGMDAAIKAADTLMYEVKKSGKGRLVCKDMSRENREEAA